jgi:hypothetical protein
MGALMFNEQAGIQGELALDVLLQVLIEVAYLYKAGTGTTPSATLPVPVFQQQP